MCSSRFVLAGHFWHFTILDQNIIIMGEQNSNRSYIPAVTVLVLFHLTAQNTQKAARESACIVSHCMCMHVCVCLSLCLFVGVSFCVLLLER